MSYPGNPNSKRHWKSTVFNYDHYLPDASEECQYCLTDKQAELIMGMIEPLAWKTRWFSEIGTEIDQDTIEEFRDDLLRRMMMSCCNDNLPIQYRYTGDGILQRSTDGGETWTDAPQYDPRNYSPQFPPMSGTDGDDKKCLAATGAADLIKQQVADQLTDGMSRYTLSQLIEDWVRTYIDTSNPLLALLTVIANQIFALVIATLRPALTTEVFNTLKCILLENMASDASFSDVQWAAVRSDITAQISGIAGIFLEHLVYLLGPVGLTNVARAGGAAEGSCTSCYDVTPVSFYTPTTGWRIIDPLFISEGSAVYTLSSEYGGGENRITILSGHTEAYPPSEPCIQIYWNVDSGPYPYFQTGYECPGTDTTPSSGSNYRQVDFTSAETSPFVMTFSIPVGQ